MIKPIQNQIRLMPAEAINHVDQIFANNGLLQESLGLEHRPEQENMAISVVRSFAANEPLLFEAGTGVGKTIAYLIPGIIHAIETQRPFIVATYTISLQEQIQDKDLITCRKLFNSIPELKPYADFKAALLVGRRNYLCPPRLTQAINTKADLFHSQQIDELERIIEWSLSTKTGLLSELNPPPSPEVWDWVNADSSLSTPRNPECFYQKARIKLQQANIIILNHALLFSLINAGAAPETDVPGVLFPNDFAVLDEAHRIPATATEHFGITLSSAGLELCLKMLYNPKRKKGLLSRHGTRFDCDAVIKVFAASELFFNEITREQLKYKDVIRLHCENWIEPSILPPLKELTERLGSLADRCKEEAREEILDQRRRLLAYSNSIQSCISLSEENHIYWIEKKGKKKSIVHMHASPIDTAPYLRKALFERHTSVLLTSATLATHNSMETFKERSGACAQEDIIVASPFDYEKSVQIYIARDMPVPNMKNAQMDITFLSDNILACMNKVDGGTLVLFTNYKDMQAVSNQLRETKGFDQRALFVQGQDYSRSELLRKFKAKGNGLLLGNDSFWTGVDIPGKALSQVILTRLPFENPKHPLIEAKAEWLQQRGINPFATMTVPDAIIKFRQGLGRLIRNKTDTGIITILDSRILTKEYGSHFQAALPTSIYKTFDASNRDQVFSCPNSGE